MAQSVPGNTKSEMTNHQTVEHVNMAGVAEAGSVAEYTSEGKAQDLALDTVNAAAGEYTEADYKRVLRKIDLVLLPLMWLCYGTQQADKTSISTQATFGMREDTHLVGQQFSCKYYGQYSGYFGRIWKGRPDKLLGLSTAFYLAYLIGEAPGNYLMQRFNVKKTLFVCMFSWGVVVLCIAFTHNFAQLVALRSLQGLFECTISPAFLLITASFYVSREHTMRSIIWGTSNSGMDILTQLVMYGIGKAAQANPSSFGPWRYISIFLGVWTILMSGFALLVLGTPNEVRWLSKEEKRIAAARVVSNQTGTDREQHHAWRWDQVTIAFKDPQTYFFFVTVIVNSLPNGGTTAFGNLVYVSFGFTPLETLVKGTIPQNLVTIAWFLFVGILTLKKPNSRCKDNSLLCNLLK